MISQNWLWRLAGTRLYGAGVQLGRSGGSKALVMTQLEASAGVPVESKKMPPLRRSIGTPLYLACE